MTSLKPFILLAILCCSEVSCRPKMNHKHKVELFEKERDNILFPKKNSKKSFIAEPFKWKTTNVDGENTVKVPYVFTSEVSSSLQAKYEKGVAEFDRLTCIRFIPRQNEEYYLEIDNNGCDSAVGCTKTGKQDFRLSTGDCDSLGHVLHENMHALGFYHEHTRPDRDSHVKINFENIEEGAEEQFQKYKANEGMTGDKLRKYPYDVDSIMHYEKFAFSKNDKPTIEDLKDPNEDVGQLKYFSTEDLFKINSIYNCAERYLNARTYQITVETDDDWFAGTDARVFIQLTSQNDVQSGEIELKKGHFERGDEDVEKHLLPNYSPIKKITVWHNNEGMGAAWDLYEVIIKDTETGQTYRFKWNDWLEGDQNKVTMTAN